MPEQVGQDVSPGRARVLSRAQIALALRALCEHGFAARWERHTNLHYWRVIFDTPGVKTYSTPWFSQSEISAWIDGARSMGAGI